MEKLALLPEAPSYSVEDGTEVKGVQLDGGLGRYRRDKLGASAAVSCTWNLTQIDYAYIRAFFNTATAKGSTPFLLDLIIDDAFDYTEHVCYFVPGSFRLEGTLGLSYVVSATLEVEPLPVDDEFNSIFITLYNEYGNDITGLLQALENYANEDLGELG